MRSIARKVMIPLRSRELRERRERSRSDLLIVRPVEILCRSGGIPVDKLSAQIFFHVARAVFDRTAHCVCGFAPTFA
jgi:hypothetical protein